MKGSRPWPLRGLITLMTLLLGAAAAPPLAVARPHTVLLTSNLAGAFTPTVQDQERSDPIIVLTRAIMAEFKSGAALYFDLGNGFYPGVLSKHSYGAAMADFYASVRCSGIVVGSMDLRLGTQTLEFLRTEEQTPFLAATIMRGGTAVFNPASIHTMGGEKVAFIGMTSRRVLFDIAEKTAAGLEMIDPAEALKTLLPALKARGASRFVLLSGLDYHQNVDLMTAYPELGLLITGGDTRGEVLRSQLLRADLADGRSIIFVPPGQGYTVLGIELGSTIRVASLEQRAATPQPVGGDAYQDFVDRISLWKQKFREETDRVIVRGKARMIRLDAERIANLLRHRYVTELAVVRTSAITPTDLGDELRSVDILSAVNDLYPIYRFTLTGEDLKTCIAGLDDHTITGLGPKREKIQGYRIEDKRRYSIAATQLVHAECERLLQKTIPVINTWKTIPDVMIADLQSEAALLRKDYRYLENRFHTLVDLSCSLLYDQTNIVMDTGMTLPVGETDTPYFKWGVDARIDLTVYNRYHRIVFSPSVNYVKNGTTLEANRLRGTLIYTLNLERPVNPFLKSQVDSVITTVRGTTMPSDISTFTDQYNYFLYYNKYRPVTIRETLGAELNTQYVTGRLGAGFEKQIHQPMRPFIYGLEFSCKFVYPFTDQISYTAALDSFVSIPRLSARTAARDEWFRLFDISRTADPAYVRLELNNKLSFRLAPVATLSLKHRLYYYYYLDNRKKYLNSQFIVSADLAMGFKP